MVIFYHFSMIHGIIETMGVLNKSKNLLLVPQIHDVVAPIRLYTEHLYEYCTMPRVQDFLCFYKTNSVSIVPFVIAINFLF